MVLRISSCRPTRLVPGLVWEIGPLVRCKGHVFGVFGLGLGGLWCFPCYLFPFFVLPISPTPEPGAIWVRLTTHTGAQDRFTSGANLSLFRRHLLDDTSFAGHCRDARVYGHTTTAMQKIEYISPIKYTPPPCGWYDDGFR